MEPAGWTPGANAALRLTRTRKATQSAGLLSPRLYSESQHRMGALTPRGFAPTIFLSPLFERQGKAGARVGVSRGTEVAR